MKTKQIVCGLTLASCLLLTGCASIICRTNVPVTINSNKPVDVVVKKSSGMVPVTSGKTPLVVTLKTSDGAFQSASYVCEATDETGKKTFYPINARFNAWTLGNFIFGGLLGIGIDGITGAMFTLDDAVYLNL